MKRPFSHRRNSASGALIGGVVTVVIVLLVILFRIVLPGTFAAIASPFWNLGSASSASTGNFFAGFGNNQKLTTENRALAEQNLELKNENAVLTARAQDLTKLLGGTSQSGETQLLAGVLARPPESPYDTLTIAAGSSDGVAVAAQVFGQGGIPLGTIKHVAAHTAQVSLYSSPGKSTNGWIGENRAPFTLTGAGGGAYTAIMPKASAIAVGDSVYVSGPGAIPLGAVVRIDTDPSSPTEVLQIQPFINLFTVTWVEVAHIAP